MISNLIYSFIFIIFVALIIALIEDKAKKNFGTKIIEIDGNHFLVPDFSSKGSDPKEIRSTGSKITCEVLSDLTGQRVRLNNYVDGSKSVITGDPVHVDCHEMTNNIMVDYKPREFFTFNGQDNINHDIYEFYDRLALDTIKKERISKVGHKYIEVPYTVDKCKKTEKGYECKDYVSDEVRKNKIRDYLKEQLLTIF